MSNEATAKAATLCGQTPSPHIVGTLMSDKIHHLSINESLKKMSALDKALYWAEQGFPVFPCRPIGDSNEKAPMTPNGFKGASTDPVKIKLMFDNKPEGTLIGGYLGGADMFAIDADLYKKERPQIEEWLDQAGFPETRTHVTASGGEHYL